MIFHYTNYYDKDTCIDDATITGYVWDWWFMNLMNSKMDVKSKHLNSCLVFMKYILYIDPLKICNSYQGTYTYALVSSMLYYNLQLLLKTLSYCAANLYYYRNR